MKGRTGNTQRTNTMSCYARGGAVSDKETVSAPVQRRHGGACSGDGKAAKPSLGIERGQAEPGREDRKDGGKVNKGPLDAKRRNALPGKSFALPGRRYPINDPNHARNALSRVSQHGSPEEKKEVRAAVHRKFPSIGKDA